MAKPPTKPDDVCVVCRGSTRNLKLGECPGTPDQRHAWASDHMGSPSPKSRFDPVEPGHMGRTVCSGCELIEAECKCRRVTTPMATNHATPPRVSAGPYLPWHRGR